MFFCTMCRYCPHWPEDGIESPENGVKMVVSHQCGCWVLNLGPQIEQPVLLTAKASLQLPKSVTICTLVPASHSVSQVSRDYSELIADKERCMPSLCCVCF